MVRLDNKGYGHILSTLVIDLLIRRTILSVVQIFTDAGQYVIRFGSSDSGVAPAAEVNSLHR